MYAMLLLSTGMIRAQEKANPYGLQVVTKPTQYLEAVKKDSNNRMVPLMLHIPGLVLDIKYASTENVFYTKLYDQPHAWMRLPAAKALANVQKDLYAMGLGLKIYDAYRPYSVTCRMFDMIPDTIYMGLPWKGSKHNRGIAVDLTVIDLKSGKELQMPTPFDALVYASHPNYMNLPEAVIRNRELLKSVMQKHGFKVDPVEWWHYNFESSQVFDILDLDPLHLKEAAR
jgi:D-alanyl-D-alanine dipeptidase